MPAPYAFFNHMLSMMKTDKKKYAVIVAGGTGSRLGGGLPKQFRDLNGKPVIWWSMKAFKDADPDTEIILVLHADYVGTWNDLYSSLPEDARIAHHVVTGGATRTESVVNGIARIEDSEDALIAVHDAARPLVSPALIRRGWEAGSAYGAAVPVVGVTDSLRKITGDGTVAVDRAEYVAVQTPQVFRASVLKGAYGKVPGKTFTDDASAAEAAGWQPAVFEGSSENMKVTNPGDLEIASLRLAHLPVAGMPR